MDFERIRNDHHRGYTMTHKEFMDDMGIEYEDLSENLKSGIRLFENKYDQHLNSDGYLDEKEEKELLGESEKIRQDIEKWYTEKDNDGNGKIATGVTLTVLGLIGLIFGINSLKD